MTKHLKPKEKMKIDRQPMPELDHVFRRSNFAEVNTGYTKEAAIMEAQRCLQCKKPTCIKGCPVDTKIDEFLDCIVNEDFLGASQKIKEDNILPAVCGRVCPQEKQCELTCVLTKKHESVAIGRLERFVADYEMEHGNNAKKPKIKKLNKKVAIIGSGPAGLGCAGDLINLGYDVTVYEALHKLGGVLVYGIPDFRLPKHIVEFEIDNLKKLGVEFITDTVIGRLFTIDELFEEKGFESVFVGVGAGLPWFLNIPGESLGGVYSANEFLTRIILMKGDQFPEYDSPFLDVKGKSVAVFGAGNTAMDAVRTAVRLGAKNAYIIYRRSDNELPARLEEVTHAREEGVNFQLLTNPTEFVGDDKGRLTAVKCIKMELGEPDENGRARPIPIPDSEFTIDLDVAIIAIGNGSNPILTSSSPKIKLNERGNVAVNLETMETSQKGVFAGGDIVTGGATVILAMGAGRKAAKAIHEYLQVKK